MATGMGPLGGGYGYGYPGEAENVNRRWQQDQRMPPSTREEDEDDDDDDDDGDDNFRVHMAGASPEQMIELRRLARVRTRAMMSGKATKVKRTQERIKYLKWQIESNA